MGVIPFPEPEPESTPDFFESILGPFVGPIFTGVFDALTASIPEGMTVGDALEEVSKMPLRDVLAAFGPPAESA